MKHLTTEPDLEQLAEPYRAVVARALAKDPDRRYGSVDSMLADLNMTPTYYEPLDRDAGTPAPTVAPPPVPVEKPRTIVAAQAVPHPQTHSLSNEPIARGIQGFLDQLRNSWERANFNTPTKFILLLISVMLFVLNSAWIVSITFFLGTIYAGYLMIWMLLSPTPNESATKGTVIAPSPSLPAATNGQQALRQNYKYGRLQLSREHRDGSPHPGDPRPIRARGSRSAS